MFSPISPELSKATPLIAAVARVLCLVLSVIGAGVAVLSGFVHLSHSSNLLIAGWLIWTSAVVAFVVMVLAYSLGKRQAPANAAVPGQPAQFPPFRVSEPPTAWLPDRSA